LHIFIDRAIQKATDVVRYGNRGGNGNTKTGRNFP
jgi:hypothetical protein